MAINPVYCRGAQSHVYHILIQKACISSGSFVSMKYLCVTGVWGLEYLVGMCIDRDMHMCDIYEK